MTISSGASPAPSATAFSSLPLSPEMLANLQQLGYAQMTPIQAASLPFSLQGRDLIAQASTGSGKTAAFGLAMARGDGLEVARVVLQLRPGRGGDELLGHQALQLL